MLTIKCDLCGNKAFAITSRGSRCPECLQTAQQIAARFNPALDTARRPSRFRHFLFWLCVAAVIGGTLALAGGLQ